MKKLFYILPFSFQSCVLFLAFLIAPHLKQDASKRYYNMYELKGGYSLDNFIFDMEDVKQKTGLMGGAYFPLVWLPNIITIISIYLYFAWS